MNATRSCILFALFTLFLLHCHGSRLVYHNDASQPDELDLMELIIGEPSKRNKQDQKGATTGLWFGPRLGRRRRALDQRREKREIDDSGPQGNDDALAKLIQDEPWALLAFRGAKRRSSTYTPRLGRNSDEEIFDNFMEPVYGSLMRTPTRSGGGGEMPATHLGPNFTPRLGRIAPLVH